MDPVTISPSVDTVTMVVIPITGHQAFDFFFSLVFWMGLFAFPVRLLVDLFRRA